MIAPGGDTRAITEADYLAKPEDVQAATLLRELCVLDRGLRDGGVEQQQMQLLLRAMLDTLAELRQGRGPEIRLILNGHGMYLGRRPSRLTYQGHLDLKRLRQSWGRLGIGGVVFPTDLTDEGLMEMALGLEGAMTDASEARALFRVPWGGVRFVPNPGEGQDHGPTAQELFCALTMLTRRLLGPGAAGRGAAPPDLLPARFALISLLDLLPAHGRLMLDLCVAPAAKRIPETQLVHTALLGMLLGQRLGLAPNELVELALAALMSGLPRTGPGQGEVGFQAWSLPGGPEEIEARHLATARRLLLSHGFGRDSLAWLVVIFESQQEFSRTDLYPGLGGQTSPHSLYSRIIALCSLYSLCSRLPSGGEEPAPSQRRLQLLKKATAAVDLSLVRQLKEAMDFERAAQTDGPRGGAHETPAEPVESTPTPGVLGEFARLGVQAAEPALPAASGETTAAVRILLVEDEPDIRMALRALLETYGFEVDEAEDGLWALKKLKENQYRLLILDLMMPHMDGFDVLRNIPPDQLKQMPVVILTARSQDMEVMRSHELGAACYLTKPFDNKTILGAVANLVGDLPPEQGRRIHRFLSGPS